MTVLQDNAVVVSSDELYIPPEHDHTVGKDSFG